MLFSKQNSRISRLSWLPNPSQISTCSLLFARSLVWGSKIRFSHSKLILELIYPDSVHAYCHPGVSNVVQLLRWVVAGHMTIGVRYLPSPLIHSIAVIVVRLTRAPLQPRRSFLPTRTLMESGWDSMTPVSSILYTFHGSILGSLVPYLLLQTNVLPSHRCCSYDDSSLDLFLFSLSNLDSAAQMLLASSPGGLEGLLSRGR